MENIEHTPVASQKEETCLNQGELSGTHVKIANKDVESCSDDTVSCDESTSELETISEEATDDEEDLAKQSVSFSEASQSAVRRVSFDKELERLVVETETQTCVSLSVGEDASVTKLGESPVKSGPGARKEKGKRKTLARKSLNMIGNLELRAKFSEKNKRSAKEFRIKQKTMIQGKEVEVNTLLREKNELLALLERKRMIVDDLARQLHDLQDQHGIQDLSAGASNTA